MLPTEKLASINRLNLITLLDKEDAFYIITLLSSSLLIGSQVGLILLVSGFIYLNIRKYKTCEKRKMELKEEIKEEKFILTYKDYNYKIYFNLLGDESFVIEGDNKVMAYNLDIFKLSELDDLFRGKEVKLYLNLEYIPKIEQEGGNFLEIDGRVL